MVAVFRIYLGCSIIQGLYGEREVRIALSLTDLADKPYAQNTLILKVLLKTHMRLNPCLTVFC
jgi:hypothetical protein